MQLHDAHRFHIQRAAAVDDAVDDGAGERLEVPVLALDGDDVGVAEQHERPLRTVAAHRRGHVHPLDAVLAAVGRVVEGDLADALCAEQTGEPVAGGLFAARRVRGVDADEIGEEARRLFGDGVPVDTGCVGHSQILVAVSGGDGSVGDGMASR